MRATVSPCLVQNSAEHIVFHLSQILSKSSQDYLKYGMERAARGSEMAVLVS